MRISILICLLFASAATGFSQTLADGFYLTTDCSVRPAIQRRNELNPKEIFCLTSQSFLSITEIDTISDVYLVNKVQFFDVTVTPKAIRQINALNTGIMNSHVVLVVDNTVVFVINARKSGTLDRALHVITIARDIDAKPIREKIVSHLTGALQASGDPVD